MSKKLLVLASGIVMVVIIVASVYWGKQRPERNDSVVAQPVTAKQAPAVTAVVLTKNQPTKISPVYQPVALQAAKQLESWYHQPLPDLIAECEKRLRENPQDVEANWKLAQVHLFAGQNREKALPYLTKLLEVEPQHKERTTIQFWITALQPPQSEPSQDPLLREITDLERKIKQNPQSPVGYVEMARSYLARGELPIARHYADQAYNLAGEEIEVYLALGKLYQNLEPRRAVRYLQRALEVKADEQRLQEIQQLIAGLTQLMADEKNGQVNFAVLETKLLSQNADQMQGSLQQLSRYKSEAAAELLGKFLLHGTGRHLREAAALLRKMNTDYGKNVLNSVWDSPSCSLQAKEAILIAYERYGNVEDMATVTAWLAAMSDPNLSYQGNKTILHLKSKKGKNDVGKK